VGAKRVIWHVGFERNLRRRGPPWFEVRSEVPLSEEPPRLDDLLLRKLTPEAESVDHRGQTLSAVTQGRSRGERQGPHLPGATPSSSRVSAVLGAAADPASAPAAIPVEPLAAPR
jgi:hypothetical protein